MLPAWPTLLLFLGATLVLLVTPGPAVFYIVTRSLDQGRRAGLASVVGVGTGTLVHAGAAALGLSALLASSALVFGVVRWAGASYLVWVGVRRILGLDGGDVRARANPVRLRRVYLDGVLVNVLNPKTALFFLAFLPQFVVPARGHVALQLATLGVLMAAIGLLSDGAYALLAGTLRRGLLRRLGRAARWQRYLSGGVFIVLGVGAALGHRAGLERP